MTARCRVSFRWGVSALVAVLSVVAAPAAVDIDEFRVKRESVFEFAQEPVVKRKGDTVTISFETKGACDVTVAIEDRRGRIIRHLACGVLGDNAPPPFQRESLSQTLTWDGKDDAGVYVDNKDNISVRVSLGLNPRFERTLFWSPEKWTSGHTPIFCPRPEGVYVYQGGVLDHLRLFDHEGNYVRTVYPFPADKVDEVKGLRRHTFPHDGKNLPLKGGFHQATLLTCGSNYNPGSHGGGGVAGEALAVHDKTAAVIHNKINWFATDGSSGGRNLEDPRQSGVHAQVGVHQSRWKDGVVPPRSAAFSPDGKWLYLTGFGWYNGWFHRGVEWKHAVTRIPANGDGAVDLFAGSLKRRDSGTGPDKLRVPTSVACDAKGRVYVTDYRNDRIQVFSPEKKLLKTIPFEFPAQVEVHRKTGHLYVFSWWFRSQFRRNVSFTAKVTHLGPFEDPKEIASYPLPWLGPQKTSGWTHVGGRQRRVALDSWAENPTFWVSRGDGNWSQRGIVVVAEKDGKLEVKREFAAEAAKTVQRLNPPALGRQRLYFNPGNGKLYVGEADAGVGKSFSGIVVIDPETGRVAEKTLPFDAEDMCFDRDGRAYLRTGKVVVRYDSRTWREIPWDYGERHDSVGFSASRDGRRTRAMAALRTPGHRSHSFWHLGGIDINLKGHLVVTTCNGANPGVRAAQGKEKSGFEYSGGAYTPQLYPGRHRWGEIHIFDKDGKPILKDAFQGIGHMNGIGIDEHDAIYCMASGHRIVNDKKYDPELRHDLSETIIKVRPGAAKVVTTGRAPVKLPRGSYPKRSKDIGGNQASGGPAWVEGAEWFYGGVGYAGKNASWASGGCCCWNARFDLDRFARTFAPELRHFSIAVLDSAGNLILRIGRYGNVDDGVPLVKEGGLPRSERDSALLRGPPNTRSIGGDEVGLFHGAYLENDTDRRLFIADIGNARLLSVKLGYHATERVALKDVADGTD